MALKPEVRPTLHSTMLLLILCRPVRLWITTFFTFHYVSINTEIKYRVWDKDRTLHSTMFLLIRRRDRRCDWQETSLHSTMFLLIRKPAFTSFMFLSTLHSTMFLLIPAPLNHRLILPYYTIFCRPWYFFIFLFISI